MPTLRSLLIALLMASLFFTIEPVSPSRQTGPTPQVDMARAATAR